MTDSDILWSGDAPQKSHKNSWPQKPPVDRCPKWLGAWNTWIELKTQNSDGTPFAAMVAINELIRAGEPLQQGGCNCLANWFNESFDQYVKDFNANKPAKLDEAFNFQKKRRATTKYNIDTKYWRPIGTMRVLVDALQLDSSISARLTVAFLKIDLTAGQLTDKFRATHKKITPSAYGEVDCYLMTYKMASEIKASDPLYPAEPDDIAALKDANSMYLQREFPGASHQDIVELERETIGDDSPWLNDYRPD